MRLILCTLLTLGLSQFANAQRIIPYEELGWETTHDPVSLKAVDPDSVYSFSYWGSSYFHEGEEPDTVFNAVDLLKCKNLQRLSLHNVAAQFVVDNLEKFPMLQILELNDVNLGEGFPIEIYELKELRSLGLNQISSVKFDEAALKKCKIEKLEFIEFSATTDDENNAILHFNVFPNLKDLYLSSSNISNADLAFGCANLERLELSECGDLSKLDLTGLDKLLYLSLYNLYALETEPIGLASQDKLTELYIRNCPFKIEILTLSGCTSIVTLLIDGCTVTDLSSIGNMLELATLTISNNGLTRLPENIGDCKMLISITASDNSISELPRGLFDLKNLNYLELSNNTISTLPKGLSSLQELNTLTLNGNSISKIEDGAMNLPKLKYLEMNYCGLKSLPADFGNLRSLYEAQFIGDSLTTIPASFLKLSNLVYLNFAYNQISTLPEGWAGLNKLYSINLSENKLNKLPKDFFALNALVSLNLENNLLKSLPTKVAKTPMLVYLTINGNQHIKYPKGIEKFPKLSFVYVNATDLSAKELAKWKKKLGEKLQVRERD